MFRAGQKVVCVDAKPRARNRPTHLVEGSIYTIHKEFDTISGYVGVLLEELKPPDHGVGWFADRFRPLTDISELEKLLIQAPVKVKEPA